VQKGIGFYFLFALAITSSVQLVGVCVVFASLILPALSTVNCKNKLFIVWLCGILSVFSGIILALIFDLPAGGLVVLAYFFYAILFRVINNLKNIRNGK
jgi:zinc/manganese transport system permease protein